MFEARDGWHHVRSAPLRQRGGHAVDVDLVGVKAFGLKEELVLGLSGKRTILSSMEGQ